MAVALLTEENLLSVDLRTRGAVWRSNKTDMRAAIILILTKESFLEAFDLKEK